MASFTIRDYDHESVTIRVTGIYEGCNTISVWIFEASNPDSALFYKDYDCTGTRQTITTDGLQPKTDYIINVILDNYEALGEQEFATTAEAKTYIFYFDFDGGSGGTESVEVEANTELPEIDNPSLNGYAFMGYFTEPNGKGVQYYDEYGGVRTYDGTYDYITLYAYWEKEYTITLDKQGGSGGTSSIYLRIGQNVRSRISIPSRDDYTFLGYFTQKQSEATDIIVQYYDADGLCVLENREWTTEYNITIYAHWRSITANFAWTHEKIAGKPFNLTATEWNDLAAFVNSKRSKAYSFTMAVKDEPFTADIYNEMVDAIGTGTKVEPRVPVTADLMNELVANANNM